jgi:Raf kinase inhibitor-like YbhB/YbcL family protein
MTTSLSPLLAGFASPAFALLAIALGGCETTTGPGPLTPPGASLSSITVTSRSVPSDQQLPVEYSCDGKNVSPELTWSSPPDGTKALVVVLEDLDVSGDFTHWLVLNLPPDVHTLKEGADVAELGAKLGQNDLHNVHYDGPCPPRGDLHRYRFRILASDRPLPLEEGATRRAVDAALAGHVLGLGSLVAVFGH